MTPQPADDAPNPPTEVSIRRARLGDIRMYQAWTAMPEVQRYQPIRQLTLAAQGAVFRQAGATSLESEQGHIIRWIIEEDGNAAGWVTLKDISWEHRTAVLGYTVAPWAQGRGVGSRGVALVLDLAFGPARLRRVEANCDVDNLKSQQLLERLGFTQEGRLRSLVQVRGQRRDYFAYGLLSEEWRGLPLHQ